MEGLIKTFVFIFLLTITTLAPVTAQDFQPAFVDYPFANSIEFETLYSKDVQQNNIAGSHLFNRFGNSKLGVFSRYSEFSHEKKQIPNFYALHLGAIYRRYLGKERSFLLMGSLGSSSDKLFYDRRDNTVSLNASYQMDEKWVILGNYSNNRAFLNNVPLPGIIYIREQSRSKVLMVGFPFNYVLLPFLNESFSLKYIGILPYNHKLRLLYNGWSIFKPYLGIEQGPVMFFDSSRRSDGLRTFWFERRGMFGIEKSFGPLLKLDLQFGYAFNRSIFYARSFSRTQESTLQVHDGLYGGVALKTSF